MEAADGKKDAGIDQSRQYEIQCSEEYNLFVGYPHETEDSSYVSLDPVWARAENLEDSFVGFYLGYSKDKKYKKRMLILGATGVGSDWKYEPDVGHLSFKGYKHGAVRRHYTTSTTSDSIVPIAKPNPAVIKEALEKFVEFHKPAEKGIDLFLSYIILLYIVRFAILY